MSAALEWQDYSIQGPFEELISAIEQWLDQSIGGITRELEIVHHGYRLQAQLVGDSTASQQVRTGTAANASSDSSGDGRAAPNSVYSSLSELSTYLPIGPPTVTSTHCLPALLGVPLVLVITAAAYPHLDRGAVPRSLARQLLGAARLAVEHRYAAARDARGQRGRTYPPLGVAVQVDKPDRQAWIGWHLYGQRETQLVSDMRPHTATTLHSAVTVTDSLRLLLGKVSSDWHGSSRDTLPPPSSLDSLAMLRALQGKISVSARWTLTPAAVVASKGLGFLGLHASAVEVWCTWHCNSRDTNQRLTGPADLTKVTAGTAASSDSVAVRVVWRPGCLQGPLPGSHTPQGLSTVAAHIAGTAHARERYRGSAVTGVPRLLHTLSLPAAMWHPTSCAAQALRSEAERSGTGAGTAHSVAQTNLAYSPVLALTLLTEAIEGAKAHCLKVHQEIVDDLSWQRSQAQSRANASSGEASAAYSPINEAATPRRGSGAVLSAPNSASRGGTGHIARVRAWIAEDEVGELGRSQAAAAVGGNGVGSGSVPRGAAAWSDEYIHAKATLMPELSAAEDLGAQYIQYIADACDEWLDEEEAAYQRARATAQTSSDTREILQNVSTGRDRLLQAVGPSITPSPPPLDEDDELEEGSSSAAGEPAFHTPTRHRSPGQQQQGSGTRSMRGIGSEDEEPGMVRASPPDPSLAGPDRTPRTARSVARLARQSMQQALQASPDALGNLLTTPHPAMPRAKGMAATLASVGGMFADALSTAALILGGPAAVLQAAEDVSRYCWYPHVAAEVHKAVAPGTGMSVVPRLLRACTTIAIRAIQGFDSGSDLISDEDTLWLQQRQNVGGAGEDPSPAASTTAAGSSSRVSHEAALYQQGRPTRLARFGPDFLGLPHRSALAWLGSAQLDLEDAVAEHATDERVAACKQEVDARLAVVQKMVFCSILAVWWSWTRRIRQLWEEATAHPPASALQKQGLQEIQSVLYCGTEDASPSESPTLLEQRLRLLSYCCESLLTPQTSSVTSAHAGGTAAPPQGARANATGAAAQSEACISDTDVSDSENEFVDAKDQNEAGEVHAQHELMPTAPVEVIVLVPQPAVLQALGAKEAVPGLLRLIKTEPGCITVAPVYAPCLQPAPPVPADTALLHTRQMSELGFARVASPVRSQVQQNAGMHEELPPSVLHPGLLQSDMGAFKACNSFATLGTEDASTVTGAQGRQEEAATIHHFLRWYAPLHWITSSDLRTSRVLPAVACVRTLALPRPEDPAPGSIAGTSTGQVFDSLGPVSPATPWYSSLSAVQHALHVMAGRWDGHLASVPLDRQAIPPHDSLGSEGPMEDLSCCGFQWAPSSSESEGVRLVPLSEHQEEQLRSWASLWADARPLPANRQRPLFNPIAAAEECLHALETMAVSDLLVQLTACSALGCSTPLLKLGLSGTSPEGILVSSLARTASSIEAQAKGYCLSSVAVSSARASKRARTGTNRHSSGHGVDDRMEASVEAGLVRQSQLDLVLLKAQEAAVTACEAYTLYGRKLALQALFGTGSDLLLNSLLYGPCLVADPSRWNPASPQGSSSGSSTGDGSTMLQLATAVVDVAPDMASTLQRSKAGDRAILNCLYPQPSRPSAGSNEPQARHSSPASRAQKPTAPPGAERLHAPLAAYTSRKLQYTLRYMVPGLHSNREGEAALLASFHALVRLLPAHATAHAAAGSQQRSVSSLLGRLSQQEDTHPQAVHVAGTASIGLHSGVAPFAVEAAGLGPASRAAVAQDGNGDRPPRTPLMTPDGACIVVTSYLPRGALPTLPTPAEGIRLPPSVPFALGITGSSAADSGNDPIPHQLIVRWDAHGSAQSLTVSEEHS